MKKELVRLTYKEEEFEKLINENLNLIKRYAHDFKWCWPAIRFETKDLEQEGILVLFYCIQRFTKKEKDFRGYLYISLKHHFWQLARKDNISKKGLKTEANIGQKGHRRIFLRYDNVYYNKKGPTNHFVFLKGLSKRAKMFINVALEIPDGLVYWMRNNPRIAYHNCVGHYLDMSRSEVQEIKKEIETKLLPF